LPSTSSSTLDAQIEDALQDDGDDDDEVLAIVRDHSTPPLSPAPIQRPTRPLPARVAKTAANTALHNLMVEEVVEVAEGEDEGEGMAQAIEGSGSHTHVPDVSGEEERLPATRENSPDKNGDVSHLSMTLHSHLSFSDFLDPWRTQREIDFDL
jgi:hypothetical protein